MANWKDIAGASKSIQKTDSIDMMPENRDMIETVMVGLLAGGRVQEFALAAQTLEKIETKANLAEVLGDLKNVITSLNKQQADDASELATLRAENATYKELEAHNG